ncbi:hypothetical protein L6452_06358 [Arctium lappa]|uniref:Uncharacterized protein n=1 Tax=Arctium lappa TaxID=4217 RepID=A0ACB9EK12_ARCLA|nr:hypothetical protein L6452_06358 [Arctium lappa]
MTLLGSFFQLMDAGNLADVELLEVTWDVNWKCWFFQHGVFEDSRVYGKCVLLLDAHQGFEEMLLQAGYDLWR